MVCTKIFQRSEGLTHHVMLRFCVRVINPLTAKLFNLNFHPLEVVSR